MLLLLVTACGGKGPTDASKARFAVDFTTDAPATCTRPCARFEWIDRGTVADSRLRIAIQVQRVPTPGISSLSDIVSLTRAGTFSDPTTSLGYQTSARGDFFERVGDGGRANH